MADDCIFCKIVAKEAEADVVHESDAILAFRDINPAAPTHILLIPKEHIPSLREVGAEHADMLVELIGAASDLAKAEGIDDGGWRFLTNVGRDALQSVDHLHFHLIGGRGLMGWPPG
jgi:histidine triad (HIT) family protein